MIRFTLLLSCLILGALTVLAESSDAGLAAAVERAKQATVAILDAPPDPKSESFQGRIVIRGTGVHLGDGYIVTARHAAERPERGELILPKEIGLFTTDLGELIATLVGDSEFLDLVLYRLAPAKQPVLAAAAALKADDPEPGQEAFTVGYPLGWGPAVTFGRIGNPNTFLPTAETRLLQADLSVCSGNSGGGLFNDAGELVGLMHAVIQMESTQTKSEHPCSRLAFAIPGGLAKRVIEAIKQGRKPAFSRLGIQLTSVKRGDYWRVAAGDVSGAALAGGIKKGDQLLTIDGMEIRDGAQLKNYLIERTTPGQVVTMRVRRADTEIDLRVTLGGS